MLKAVMKALNLSGMVLGIVLLVASFGTQNVKAQWSCRSDSFCQPICIAFEMCVKTTACGGKNSLCWIQAGYPFSYELERCFFSDLGCALMFCAGTFCPMYFG